MAALHARLDQIEQAVQCFAESIAILERLTVQAPEVGRYQQDLAVSCNNLGLLQSRSGLSDAAAAEFRRALQIQQKLVAAHPRNPEYLSGLAGIHNNLGLLLLRENRVAEATDAFHAAVARQTAALELAPEVKRFREMLDTHRANLEKAAQRALRSEREPDADSLHRVGSTADVK